MSEAEWGPDGFDYPEWAYDPVDYCDRCGARLGVNEGTAICVNPHEAPMVELYICQRCELSWRHWCGPLLTERRL